MFELVLAEFAGGEGCSMHRLSVCKAQEQSGDSGLCIAS
jgi:hypothetical protein